MSKTKINEWGQEITNFSHNNENGKIKIANQPTFSTHRSGWNFAVNSIKSLHNDNTNVNFYGFLENEFGWRFKESKENGIIPMKSSWVGFFHNPPNAPWWFNPMSSAQFMLMRDELRASLESCLGLFSLSEYHADFLREVTGKPVESLIHPTEIPEKQFCYESFLSNTERRLISIGYWLRRVNSIYALPITNDTYIKTRILPYKKNSEPHRFVDSLRTKEFRYEQDSVRKFSRWMREPFINVEELYNFPNEKYDELLSKNIVYLDMYDSSANNAVIECIARATPILVNPIPAVVEYLGHKYPFYFESFDEAVDKLMDTDLIFNTHEYLKTCDTREKLTEKYFLDSFKNTEIYRSIQ